MVGICRRSGLRDEHLRLGLATVVVAVDPRRNVATSGFHCEGGPSDGLEMTRQRTGSRTFTLPGRSLPVLPESRPGITAWAPTLLISVLDTAA